MWGHIRKAVLTGGYISSIALLIIAGINRDIDNSIGLAIAIFSICYITWFTVGNRK